MVRLTRARWLEEGLTVLQEDGPAALAADRMAKRLGVSRGSFYWHFANAMDFAAAVLAEWEDRWTNQIIAAIEAVGGKPQQRLFALIEKTGGQDASIYASAKRMARQHPDVGGGLVAGRAGGHFPGHGRMTGDVQRGRGNARRAETKSAGVYVAGAVTP